MSHFSQTDMETLLKQTVYWVDDDRCIREGTLAEFDDIYTVVEECCSPRGIEKRWQMEEIDVWTIGDFWEKARNVCGQSLKRLLQEGDFFLDAESAEDALADCDDPDADAFVSSGTLFSVCRWELDGKRDHCSVFCDKAEALAELERIWLIDFDKNCDAPTTYLSREDAEAALAEFLEEEE